MKKLLGFVFFFVLGIFIFATVFSQIDLREVWKTLREFSLLQGFVIFLLTAVFFYIGAAKWQKVLAIQGVKISTYNINKAYLAGFAISFFSPMVVFGAELFRAYSLTETDEVPFDKGIASVIIDRIMEVTTYVIAIVIGILVLLLWGSHFSAVTAIIIAATLVGISLLLFFFYYRMFRSKSIVGIFMRRRRGNNLVEIENEITAFFHWNNPKVWEVFFLALLKAVVGWLRAWMLMIFLGGSFKLFFPAITVLGFYYLALLVPIPASLGTHDGLQALSFGAFGLGSATGAAFAFIVRAVEMIFAFIGSVFFAHLGLQLLRDAVFARAKKFFRDGR